jgi:RNA polymerase sigma factor (sigma-70 family)
MASGPLRGVLRHIRKLAGAPDLAEPSDADLLKRFAYQQDGEAFADLVQRHGPMVLGVCRRILRNADDADDAFQATFLILVRKAAGIARPGALGCWLHEVALRTALRARAQAAVRKQHERQVPEMPQSDFLAAVAWRDLQPVLDEEIARLPARYREPFVLCYLQEQTYEQTAGQLHCLPGTVSRRLAQAREMLRKRLTRRGLSLPAGVLAAALAESSARAVVMTPLVTTTVQAALASAAGKGAAALSGPVAALVEGGLHAMTVTKVKTIVGVCLAVGLLCAGAGLVAREALTPAAPESGPQTAAVVSKSKKDAKPAVQKQTGDTVAVTGRVVGPDGKPVPAARLLVLDMPEKFKRYPYPAEEEVRMEIKDQGRSDAGGRFRLHVPRQPIKREISPVIAARAEGYGLGMVPITAGMGKKEIVLQLPPEKVLRVRLVDLQGVPAKNVVLRLSAVLEKKAGEEPLGVIELASRLPGWFPPLRTDAEGRIEVHGVGPKQAARVLVSDKRFAPTTLVLGQPLESAKSGAEKPAPSEDKEIVKILEPPHLIRGRVTYKDTGKPAAGAVISEMGRRVRADAQGRFELSPDLTRMRLLLSAQPPSPDSGPSPYVGWERFIPVPKGQPDKAPEYNFALPRGVIVRGKVVEAGSGKALANAGICFVPRQKPVANPYGNAGFPAVGLVHALFTRADGTFTVTAPVGTGTLIVKAERPDYVPVTTSMAQMALGKPGGQPLYAHAIQVMELRPGMETQDVTIALHRGLTVKGKLVGPDGQSVHGAKMLSRLATSCHLMGFIEARAVDVPDSGFELGGCDPKQPYPVIFFQAKKDWGTVVELPGKQTGKPLTIRLQPCGKAKARFVNAAGEPIEGHWPAVEVVLKSGPSLADPKAAQKGLVAADATMLANIFYDSYQLNDFRTDAEGRMVLTSLVPGVTYRIVQMNSNSPVLRDFTARPGETVDLGDIVIGKKK